MKISVIIPSRLARFDGRNGSKPLFLERAVKSLRAQTQFDHHAFDVIVGIDEGSEPEVRGDLAEKLGVRFAISGGRSQAAALNAAARLIDGDYVAFLEDDDRWHPQFLQEGLKVLRETGFVSSTQLEVTQSEEIVRINDFPTPSGWLMRREVWEAVGAFNEEYKWHLDHEWLGQLAEKQVTRSHLVEATAPVNAETAMLVRPWLFNVLKLGGPSIRLVRHSLHVPLIFRLVHPDSGMQRIKHPANGARSTQEYDMLMRVYGRLPW